ncbi:hypothetical protein D3C75_795870 [compost metagenome]
MHLVVIPPGGRAVPHLHIGYETGISVLEGRVLTRWVAALENEIVSEAETKKSPSLGRAKWDELFRGDGRRCHGGR